METRGSSRRRRQLAGWLLFGLLAATGACSFIVETNTNQCATDGDCSRFGDYSVCQSGVCVKPTALTDGGMDASDGEAHDSGSSDGGDAGDGSADGSDGSSEMPDSGPLMCFEGMPTTDPEFLNQCTDAGCVPFDDCARIGVCDGGLPALVPPGDGGLAPVTDAGGAGPGDAGDGG